MKRNITLLVSILVASLCFAQKKSTIYKKDWIDFNKNSVKDIFEDPQAKLNDRIENLLSLMTTGKKTAKMAILYGSGHVFKDLMLTPQ
jgi:beta-glucosidase